MEEFGFEIRLCAHLEGRREAIISRQLGGGVTQRGQRVLDIVVVEPGPSFNRRAQLTSQTIPSRLLDAGFGPGQFRDWRRSLADTIDARQAVERGCSIGYLERDFEGARERVRAVDRYPRDWFGRIIAIENKPRLGDPGELYEQLRFDVSLGVVDMVILATASHVTRAHRNRLPDAVGIWRFDPAADTYEVLEEPTPLTTDRTGLEICDQRPGRTDIELIDVPTKRRIRRTIAERAYGKGWRTFTFPPCANLDAEGSEPRGLPYCRHFDRLVDPARMCNHDCEAFRAGEPPAIDLSGERARRSPWVVDPPDRRTYQGRLGDFDQVG